MVMDKIQLDKLQSFVDTFKPYTCIMAVDRVPGNGYGEIRIVTGNTAYLDSVIYPINADSPARNDGCFIPDQPYEHYIPKNLNFEEFCYRCAILGEPLHSYVFLDHFGLWFDIYMMPLDMNDEKTSYCTYTMELNKDADVSKMTDISYKTASEVLSACIKLSSSTDFRKAIESVVCDIREICGAAHCCILLTDNTHRKCNVLAESFAEDAVGYKPMATYLNDDFYDITLSWNDLIAESNCIIIKNKDDMELVKQRAPDWYASLMTAGVESIVLFPLKMQGETLGYIWSLNFDVGNTLHIKQALELTTLFIASEIAGYQMIDRLKALSTIDLLTGVNNRNAMNNYIEKFQWSHTLGIVFADLNGLKRINDTEGHFAGDLLLKNAALALQRIFAGSSIFRSGGDEFVVFAPDITNEELEKRIKALHGVSEMPDAPCFAVGSVFSDKKTDIRKMMQTADKLMYQNKALYYSRHTKYDNR